MDFSSLNPNMTNALHLAARLNDVKNLRRLLKKMNPNCVDNRGWTCLHEAAFYDSYESVKLILEHPQCRPLAETHEGETALYLACRHSRSLKTIEALLKSEKDSANYCSTERLTPLHIVCGTGRLEVIQLLIENGALIDVQDFDGDTPLHDAVDSAEAVAMLLHVGANPEIKNRSLCTPFHMACLKGVYDSVITLFPFVTDINQVTTKGDSPLILATKANSASIVKFLLENGADPHIRNDVGDLALDLALQLSDSNKVEVLSLLLSVTNKDKINRNIILRACKPHFFNFETMDILLNYDFGPEYFDFSEPFHVTLEEIDDLRPCYDINPTLNLFLNICEYIYCLDPKRFQEFFYLFLMRGASVNALTVNECPPLVYLHYCNHENSFTEIFQILVNHGCDVDYSSITTLTPELRNRCMRMPDAVMTSLTADPTTAPLMMPYSLHCEPDFLISFALKNGIIGRLAPQVQKQLLFLLDSGEELTVSSFSYTVMSLKHLSRLKARYMLRRAGVKTTAEFLSSLERLPLPPLLKNYLRYL